MVYPPPPPPHSVDFTVASGYIVLNECEPLPNILISLYILELEFVPQIITIDI